MIVGLISAAADTGSIPIIIGTVPATKESPEFSGDFNFRDDAFRLFNYCPKFRKTYLGRTSNYEGRLDAYIHSLSKGFAMRFQPWVFFIEECASVQEASQKEKYYKTGVGREVIKNESNQLSDRWAHNRRGGHRFDPDYYRYCPRYQRIPGIFRGFSI